MLCQILRFSLLFKENIVGAHLWSSGRPLKHMRPWKQMLSVLELTWHFSKASTIPTEWPDWLITDKHVRNILRCGTTESSLSQVNSLATNSEVCLSKVLKAKCRYFKESTLMDVIPFISLHGNTLTIRLVIAKKILFVLWFLFTSIIYTIFKIYWKCSFLGNTVVERFIVSVWKYSHCHNEKWM